MQLTIPQAARLYGKHRTTIHRHIESGRLSCGFLGDGTRVVDMAELVRCYGEAKHSPPVLQPPATGDQEPLQHAMLQALHAMHRELVALREEVATLRQLPPPPRNQGEGTQGEDDPNGLRALVQNLRDNDKER